MWQVGTTLVFLPEKKCRTILKHSDTRVGLFQQNMKDMPRGGQDEKDGDYSLSIPGSNRHENSFFIPEVYLKGEFFI